MAACNVATRDASSVLLRLPPRCSGSGFPLARCRVREELLRFIQLIARVLTADYDGALQSPVSECFLGIAASALPGPVLQLLRTSVRNMRRNARNP